MDPDDFKRGLCGPNKKEKVLGVMNMMNILKKDME